MASTSSTKPSLSRSVAIRLLRIAIAYLAGCMSAGLALVAMSILLEHSDQPLVFSELAVAAGFYAFFTAIFAAPVALGTIVASEWAHWRHPALFAAAGAVAPLPLLFRADGFDAMQFLSLVPAGIVGGLAYWLVRFGLRHGRPVVPPPIT